MNIIEVIAVLFSLASVILTVKNKVWCWPVGIIGIIFYTILFFQYNIIGNALLQFLFIGQSLYGWYNWNKPSKYPIKWVSKENRESILGATGLLAVLFSMIINNKGGQSPYFDGITTSLSIMAMLLMAYRKIDAWVIWIIADILFIIFFYINGLYLSSGIYAIFLILATLGLFEWRKSIKKD